MSGGRPSAATARTGPPVVRDGWAGEWVAGRLGIALTDLDRPVGVGLTDLVGLAVRRNPRRAHLLVSEVLGKHVPADPRLVRAAGLLLGELVRGALPDAALPEQGRRTPDPAVPHPAVPARGRRTPDARVTALLDGALHGDEDAARSLRSLLADAGAAPLRALVVGYAETATALGHCVADVLGGAYYLHSTRRPVPGLVPYGGFEEEHSHATSHLLLPADPGELDAELPVVLVDDEISTGATARNTIRSLHAARPRDRYVVAALVDLRGAGDRAAMAALADEIGAHVEVVALASGRVVLPDGLLGAAGRLVASLAPPRTTARSRGEEGAAGASRNGQPAPEGHRVSGSAAGAGLGSDCAAGVGLGSGSAAGTGRESGSPGDADVLRVDVGWPEGLPDGGRHGFTPAHRERLEAALPAMASRLAAALPSGLLPSRDLAVVRAGETGDADGRRPRVLVLGFEELMYAPLRLAEALADRLDGAEVRYSTTTRSPVLAVDDPGYAIRTRLAFPAHDDPADGPGERYAYNVAAGGDAGAGEAEGRGGHGPRFDAIVLVVDEPADTGALRDGLLARLAELGGAVLLVVLPSWRPAADPAGPAVRRKDIGHDIPDHDIPDHDVAGPGMSGQDLRGASA